MSPAADVLYTAVTYTDDDGRERYGYAMVPRDDARRGRPRRLGRAGHARLGQPLGLLRRRASCPRSALRGGFPVGDAVAYMERNLDAGLFHAAASLGIAESAHASVARQLARRGSEHDPHTQMLAAESAVDLAACRAVLARAAALIDEHHARNPTSRGTAERADRACSPRRRAPRRSSTRPPSGSSTARSRSPAAPAT